MLYAIFWSYLRSLSIWKVSDLDKIHIGGDQVFKSLNTRSYLNVDELPRFIETNGMISNTFFTHLKQGEATKPQDLNILMITGGVTLLCLKEIMIFIFLIRTVLMNRDYLFLKECLV